MTSSRMQFAVALAVCSCLFLPACPRPTGDGFRPKAAMHTITFSASNGNCQQSLDGGANATVVDVTWGATVNFTAGAGHAYALTFVAANVSCASPFQGVGPCQPNFSSAA